MKLRTTFVVEYDVNPDDYEQEIEGETTISKIVEAEQRIIDEDASYAYETMSFEGTTSITVEAA